MITLTDAGADRLRSEAGDFESCSVSFCGNWVWADKKTMGIQFGHRLDSTKLGPVFALLDRLANVALLDFTIGNVGPGLLGAPVFRNAGENMKNRIARLFACFALPIAASCSTQHAGNAASTTAMEMQASAAPSMVEPGGTPDDARLALLNSDEYAWKLFLYVNRQAKSGVAGVADDSKATIHDYDPDKPVVWETWALASGLGISTTTGNTLVDLSEVFKDPAVEPVAWDQLNRTTSPKILSQDFNLLLGRGPSFRKHQLRELLAPIGENPKDEEVRMNRSTYETIRTQNLYSLEGVEAAVGRAEAGHSRSIVTFDPTSKEIKAQWVHLADCDANPNCPEKQRFHWRTVVINRANQIWGLAAFHIITKDLPNWVWTDFIQVDCENASPICKTVGAAPTTPLRDSTTNGPNGVGPSGKNGVRNETIGSKWSYYRLRGTQIDFTTSTGVATVLSSPVIEKSRQNTSCMTCHAYASAATPSQQLHLGTGTSIAGGIPNVGIADDRGVPTCGKFYSVPDDSVDPKTVSCPAFFDATAPLFYQTDFLWSIPFRVFSVKPAANALSIK